MVCDSSPCESNEYYVGAPVIKLTCAACSGTAKVNLQSTTVYDKVLDSEMLSLPEGAAVAKMVKKNIEALSS